MINLLEIALFLVKLTMHPSLFFYFHNAAGSRASQEGFFTWSVDFKVFVSKKSPKNRENSVVSYAYRRTDYPTGTDPESGSRSQVGTGIEPILKFQDPESYRNRGFWNRSNTRAEAGMCLKLGVGRDNKLLVGMYISSSNSNFVQRNFTELWRPNFEQSSKFGLFYG